MKIQPHAYIHIYVHAYIRNDEFLYRAPFNVTSTPTFVLVFSIAAGTYFFLNTTTRRKNKSFYMYTYVRNFLFIHFIHIHTYVYIYNIYVYIYISVNDRCQRMLPHHYFSSHYDLLNVPHGERINGMAADCLLGCLVGWLVGCLVKRLPDWSTICLNG